MALSLSAPGCIQMLVMPSSRACWTTFSVIGGGVITARMNGKKELLSIDLSPDAITPDDPELMGDLIVAAVNEAGRAVDAEIEKLTQGMTAGLKMPGLF